MQIPRYWARAIVDDAGNPTGDAGGYHGIGWSLASQEEADRMAVERARSVQQRIATLRRGENADLDPAEMYYGNRPVREPIIDELKIDDHPVSMITRNVYGALVLNTASAMFVDVDLPPPRIGPGLIGRLLGKKQPPPDDPSDTLERMRAVVEANPGMGLRVYRTPNGFRGLVTSQPYDPASDEAERMLAAFQSDSLYISLCKVQQCFRARLTPKPWRIGMDTPPRTFPFTDPRKQKVFDQWQAEYDRRISGYAACEPVAEVPWGNPDVHPDVAPVMTMHDELACSPGKALA